MDAGAAVAETHIGIVFLVGDRAYKLKKPVDLGFLDFRTREARERACRREVELNRRLAPDVYLGVADVHGVDGELCDHMVVMRRMPPDRRLSALVTGGVDVGEHLRRIARQVASFHAGATRPPAASAAAGSGALAARWEANVGEMQQFRGALIDSDDADRVAALARRYLDGRGPLFEDRVRSGHAVDGHGDLLADDIFCLDDGPRILDCLEFDDALRFGDTVADVAFLAMDLERLGRPDLAASFLVDYQEFAGDRWPASLGHHHIAYRAHVRCKVACLRAAQGDGTAPGQARSLLTLARRHLEVGRVRLVVVGGPPGTGKSTVATALGDAVDAVVLRSDEVRKELLGIGPTDRATAPFRQGAYASRFTWATYETLLRRAAQLLAGGESVVLDATWLDGAWRGRVEHLARAASADLTAIRCVLPPAKASDRLRRRAAAGTDPSDATTQVQEAMAAADRPWAAATDLDTSGSPDAVARSAVRLVTGTDRSSSCPR